MRFHVLADRADKQMFNIPLSSTFYCDDILVIRQGIYVKRVVGTYEKKNVKFVSLREAKSCGWFYIAHKHNTAWNKVLQKQLKIRYK